MNLIDRYVLRQFFWTFAICFCSLTGLYFVIDAFGNLEEFGSYAEKSQSSLMRVMTEYYSYQTLSFFDRTSGILTLIAAMFTLASLQRFNELTALLAAGTSKLRIVRPLLVAGVVIALLATANRELLIPKIRDKLSRSAQNLGSKRTQPITPTFDPQTGMVFNGGGLNFKEKTILEPQVAMPRGLIATNRPLIAKVAHYEPVTAEHPDGYRLQEMVEPIDLKLVPSYKLQVENPGQANSITDKTILYTPHDSPWLKDDECFVVTEMSFDEIAFPDSWKQFSSTRELIRSINNRGSDVGNGVLTTVHMRLVQPVLDSVLMLLGIPLILRGANRNIFVAIGLSIVVIASFMLVITIGQSLSSNYLINPLLGAWLPLFIFVPVAAYLGEPLWE